MIHTFNPTHYFNTLGSHPPVLRVSDGDTIITSCVDAAGGDAKGDKIASGPNPMSGPFFVDGAAPGDTLAVDLKAIRLTRAHGWTRNVLAQNVVEPHYAQELPDRYGPKGVWQIDTAAGTTTLLEPKTALGNLALPLNPMPGCFGVAPALGQAISTETSGRHGGNMDYNGFVAGVTAYFPVEAEGALFFIGDAHARQGDGEISGTGIEISSEMEFALRVIKNKRIGTVRGENATHIFAVGNARPLDEAAQIATTEMSRWLMEDYGLDHFAVGLLMGQCVEYNLGNMFDPAYTMVCKMPKQFLKKLG